MFGHTVKQSSAIPENRLSAKKSGIRGPCLNIILPKALSKTVFPVYKEYSELRGG